MQENKKSAGRADQLPQYSKSICSQKEVQQAIEYFNKSKELAKQLKNTSAVAAIDAELIALQYKTETAELSENKLISTIDLFKQQGI